VSSLTNLAYKVGRPEPGAERKFNVFQGQYKVSNLENAVLSTLLGSCVAVCMYDPEAGVGGMNHFLVPGGQNRANERSLSHGSYSMELLINGLLKRCAERKRLIAKLFGGASVMAGLSDVGKQNAEFARSFLATEDIHCVSESLGGKNARRINFWPCTGRVQQLIIPIDEAPVVEEVVEPEAATDDNDLELF
jgi:chemotaxis protein CheD